jgi:predicted RNA methylase
MGLENVVQEEISGRRLRAENVRVVRQLIGEGKRKVLFECEPDAEKLSRLGTIEDLYLVLSTVSGAENFKRLGSAIEKALASDAFHAALKLERAVSGRSKPSRFDPLITIHGRGKLRRRDVRVALVSAVSARLPKWKTAEKDGLGLWVDVSEKEAIFSVRLKSRRSEKRREFPGAIPASVANAMIYLTYPWGGEIFCDPFCGSGTIALERMKFPRAGRILCGDIDSAAADISLVNLGKSGVLPVRMNATQLALPAESVDVIVTNPPWGEQHDSGFTDIWFLHEHFAAEAGRVLRPKGRLAVITSEKDVFDRALKKTGHFTITKCFVVNCLGLRPNVFIAHKK